MKYDFTTVLDRTNIGAAKWELMKKTHPNVQKGVVPFTVADMEFPTAPEITEAIKTYVDTHTFGYTMPTAEYFDALNYWTTKYYDFEVAKEDVVIAAGVVGALHTSVVGCCEKGDGIIIMPPVYQHFFDAVVDSGCEQLLCPLINNNEVYTIDFDLFESQCKDPNTKMFIFCSPHNPVGRVWTKEELYKIGTICKENGVIIVSDEIHWDITMPGHKHISMASFKEFDDILILCTAPSKTFNVAALQDSNIIIKNPELRAKFQGVLALTHTHVGNPFSFLVCTTGYRECEAWKDEMIEVVYDNYLYVKNYLAEKLPMITMPELEGTYIVWLNCKSFGIPGEELTKIFADNNMFFNNGSMMGTEGEGYLRVILACPKSVVVKLMDDMAAVVATLQA